jgi:hypothetical protein
MKNPLRVRTRSAHFHSIATEIAYRQSLLREMLNLERRIDELRSLGLLFCTTLPPANFDDLVWGCPRRLPGKPMSGRDAG